MLKIQRKRMIPLVIVIILVLVCAWYLLDYYHATDRAKEYIFNTDNVIVSGIRLGLEFDGPGNDDALIFYPGGKVEYTAYAPLMRDLAEEGIDCYLVKMPVNLAFLGVEKADSIIEEFPHEKWYIGGHSLGGVAASMYAADHDLDGLVLLASYPTKEIDEPTLEIYGTEDGVLIKSRLEEADKYLPIDNLEVVINGGNHAQFGDYGEQVGDGIAAITREEQQRETIEEIVLFFETGE